MTTARAEPAHYRDDILALPTGLRLDRPNAGDGAALWRIAHDSRALDLNSPYSYLLWCRDFAGTSAVARDASGQPVGFVSGYLRPEAPRTLLIWQIAVDEALRGLGVAGALLDALSRRVAEEHGLRFLEATVTPDNAASERLFTSYAERHGGQVRHEVLFESGQFPDEGHEAEVLYRIGPLSF
ncbi:MULTISPECIES: diaminobutyrate acetyltransferase [unclassified Streptomyces]|uniref:diaminobutyrate acetyltransferase n=1 Tax=unclassified Streptomyces TaxID=2593676 RepID=UPI0004ABAF33|nr:MULTISPECIES: diaminobutyrate acetyltransferase [unclassified Streptomyces]APU43286.1 diaminobutyrate acetyltransferase [Streptomyces sp. TN58]KJK53728.1 hypothetical protein UK14_05225 [Streptomyces sp. NRRL F-4428]